MRHNALRKAVSLPFRMNWAVVPMDSPERGRVTIRRRADERRQDARETDLAKVRIGAHVAGLLLALGALQAPLPALAQGVVKAQYGDWQMSCDTPPGASFEQCAIIQNVTAEDQPNVGLSVIVLKTADQKARLLRVLAPLGVLLPNGLGLNIDGTDMGRVAFVRCLPNGCVAEVVMDDALVKQLSEGKTAIFVVFKTPEEGIGIPVSLNGFADGFKQLP
jgi:invasion protein IalB